MGFYSAVTNVAYPQKQSTIIVHYFIICMLYSSYILMGHEFQYKIEVKAHRKALVYWLLMYVLKSVIESPAQTLRHLSFHIQHAGPNLKLYF